VISRNAKAEKKRTAKEKTTKIKPTVLKQDAQKQERKWGISDPIQRSPFRYPWSFHRYLFPSSQQKQPINKPVQGVDGTVWANVYISVLARRPRTVCPEAGIIWEAKGYGYHRMKGGTVFLKRTIRCSGSLACLLGACLGPNGLTERQRQSRPPGGKPASAGQAPNPPR
jgi:hypothetical protein